MTPIAFAVYSLATWRIASLLVCEDGPADIFKRLRQAVCNRRFLRDLLGCVWCSSVWVGVAIALVCVEADVFLRLAAGLAFSAVAILIQRWMEMSGKELAA